MVIIRVTAEGPRGTPSVAHDCQFSAFPVENFRISCAKIEHVLIGPRWLFLTSEYGTVPVDRQQWCYRVLQEAGW